MFSKTKMVFAAALILGTATAALAANEHDDSVSETQALREHGNPLPWWWNTPAQGRASVANAGNAFGFASPTEQQDLPRKKSHGH